MSPPWELRAGRRMKPSERLKLGMQVRAMLALGLSHEQIAKELNVSVHLVKRWPTRRRA